MRFVVDVGAPLAKRQAKLNRIYHFQCDCERCLGKLPKLKEADSYLDMNRENKPYEEWIIDPIYKKMELKLDSEIKQGELFVQKKQYKEAINILTHSLQACDAFLHDYHLKRLEIHSLLLNACILDKQFDNALFECQKINDFYTRLYHQIHPIVGLHYITWIDLLKMKKIDSHQFTDLLRKAISCLSITHGKTHPFCISLMNQMKNMQP